ncbi:hypothetical protein B5S28_g3924 [[Candida] boidinii]|uniref:Unnamed protein product n=1 Tax=Candida boidinii TaxID=5477 RepID=A0ACB5TFT8_CANBO|nr:hypothetical protein B5S28_g3924 [[Candida] boidinii]OWB59709.1 hypothetical protein B5S29_g571 [[Candida] boidinii]OWB72555.1 hypothetical protein B5S31_g2271 [[Candida] boidinii]OWB79653.1 hypothetical protein B5S32_g3883 [[Candida] boidinii]GME87972.1 unnamed protein product [[Candida] boidinii]
MAHSLRSKSKLKAKSVKRHSEFQPKEDARKERLAQKMKENLTKQVAEKAAADAAEGKEVAPVEDKMEDDSNKTVSTSGWRKSRHHVYKKNQKLKNKSKNKNKFTKF